MPAPKEKKTQMAMCKHSFAGSIASGKTPWLVFFCLRRRRMSICRLQQGNLSCRYFATYIGHEAIV